MGIKDKLKYVFSIDTKTTNRIVIYILGIRIRHLKPSLKNKKQEYIKLNCPVSEIPKAEGFLRKIQLANLKTMSIVDKLCKENDVHYWIDFGNLLGAARHKGFIPWDDDFDIGMVRDDYERFFNLFKDGIPGYDDLYLTFDNNGKNKCLLKVRHKKISSINLDIFPYDFYYKKVNDSEKEKLTKEIKKITLSKFNKLLYPFYKNKNEKMRNRFTRLKNKYILKNNIPDKTVKPALFMAIDYPHLHKNLVFDYDTIFPLKTVNFEYCNFSCVNNYEEYLTKIFGNYMELPDDCYPKHSALNAYDNEEELLDEFINQAF